MLEIDHIHFYVDNAQKWRDWFVAVLGFQSLGNTTDDHTHTEVVYYSHSLLFLLSSPLNYLSPVARYLKDHAAGVVDVAFRVGDLDVVVNNLSDRSLSVSLWESPQGSLRYFTVYQEQTLRHTVIERHGITPILPTINVLGSYLMPDKLRFLGIDHLVLNVRQGELENYASWYERVFGFVREETFNIQTEKSGLYSQVMTHPSSGLKFPINEPLSANSQIQEFIDFNNGVGIQHIALQTSDIISLIAGLRGLGLQFIHVPDDYYISLKSRLDNPHLSDSELEKIYSQKILVDCKDTASLLQIFTRPIFDKPTFFWEFIERRNYIQGFGERNFQALFEAIETMI